MRRILVCSVLAAALVVSSCDILNAGAQSDENSAETIILLGEDDALGSLLADRATVRNIDLRGSRLTLTVTYSGGCKEHEFRLYAARGFVETNPPGAEVYLAHDANGDVCRALITDELTFDILLLERLFLEMYPSDRTFFVIVHEPTGENTRFKHIEPESPLYRRK